MPRKTRNRVARKTESPARHGTGAATGDVPPGRAGNRLLPVERIDGRPRRPVHTIRVSALFL
ncbi:hypothetical protein [Streptomyces sp. NPDC004284]|uniref:hypothetical protein n=1 Tax=Streptomyces sp. NPDC004284 TaxID=3364695 RepID=UPI00369AB8F5